MKMITTSILASIMMLSVMSCGNDETPDDNQVLNQFEFQDDVYTTSNAAFLFDSNSNIDISTGNETYEYDNAFTILLTDGTIYDDGGYPLISTDAKQAIFLEVINDYDPVDALADIDLTTRNYGLSNDTESITSISEISSEVTVGGVSYGEIESGFYNPFSDTDQGNVTINSLEIDFDNKLGTIDCTYSISSAAVGLVSGQYKGDFVIMID